MQDQEQRVCGAGDEHCGAAAAPSGRGLVWRGFPPRVDRGVDGARFGALGCRGFSFAFSTAPTFRIAFPRRIDLRFALDLPRSLTHPPAVVRALRRDRCRHVTSGGGRCAGFALGSARRERGATMWYVYALQSDMALLGRGAVRDYLRGWRKVLMACVLNAAAEAGVAAVHLAPAAAVFDAARSNRAFGLTRMPDLWGQIYDRTAGELGMEPVEISAPLNIQTLPHRRTAPCRTFRRLWLDRPDDGGGGDAGGLPAARHQG
jgi:hypothetical protein